MAAIANELDKILIANPAPPEAGELGRTIMIATSSPGGFKIASNGVATPAIIELSAILVNVQGTVSWSASNGVTLSIDGNAASLDAVDMIAESATITASLTYNGAPYERTIVINKVRDGANGDSAEPPDLSAEALLDTLTGQITDSQLYSALRTRINLIDAAPSVPGSVGARILTEENARKDAVAAEASARQVALSNFDTSIKSYVQTYAYSKASDDAALSSLATQLRAEFSSNNGAAVSWVQEYAYSRAETDSAIAEKTSTISTTVNGHTTTLQTQATSINGLMGMYSFKIDNNGYTTGFGLSSEIIAGRPVGSFIISADKFAVVSTGMAPKFMFTVGKVNGANVLGFSGSAVFDGTMTIRDASGKILLDAGSGRFSGAVAMSSLVITGSAGSLNRDPYFTDLSTWALGGNMGGATGPGGAAPANTFVQGSTDYASASSERFPIDSAKSYNASVSIWSAGGNNRAFRVGLVFYDGSGTAITSSWSDGYGAHFVQNTIAGGDSTWRTHKSGNFGAKVAGRAIPISAKFCSVFVQINAGGTGTSSAMAATGLRVDEMMSEVLIEPKSISAPHINANTLAALIAYLGNCQLGIGGALYAGPATFDSGQGLRIGTDNSGDPYQVMRSASGKYIRIRPSTDTFEFNGMNIVGSNFDNPKIISSFSVALTALTATNQPNATTVTFNKDAVLSGGVAPFRYLWSLQVIDAPLSLISDPSAPTATIRASGNRTSCTGYLMVQVTDANGISKTATCNVTIVFGDGALT